LRFRPHGKAAAFIGLLCLLSGSAAYSGTLSVIPQSRWVNVEHVLDGDTFVSTKGEHVRQLGQFRGIHGRISRLSRNRFGFHLGRLGVSIPRKYRQYFRHPPLIKTGDDVVVHGVVRKSPSGLYVALHSPYDMEKL